jgi:hypothetical protein
VVTSPASGEQPWVVLIYRLPRLPSAPRLAVWRRLKRLGVAQLSDGVVALPEDSRTREHLEWVAEEVTQSDGTAQVWLAQPLTAAAHRNLAAELARARAEEYSALVAEVEAVTHQAPEDRARALRRVRRELRLVQRRDYFPPPERESAQRAVDCLAQQDQLTGRPTPWPVRVEQ